VSSPNNLLLWVTAALVLGIASVAQAESQRFVVQCAEPYQSLVAAVEALGGEVTYQYKNIGAVAVTVPADRRLELLSLAGVDAVYKDRSVAAPEPTEQVEIDASAIDAIVQGEALRDAMAERPEGFLHNLRLTGASTLHLAGIDGSGVLVAIIDTGTANNPALVPSLRGRVIGGESLVPFRGEPSATSTLNHPHGTWVGSTIAGNVGFVFLTESRLVQSVLTHAPASVLDFPVPGLSLIPMVGTAPAADIYAVKVFPSSGAPTPESRIVAAMDRVITIRDNFNNGLPFVPVSGSGAEDDPFVFDSAPIEIVNMSLGGPTFFAGGDLQDQLTLRMQDVGITLVTSAGNDGPAAMTGGSPGTGKGSLTSGAASLTANERVLRDLQFFPLFGFPIGSLYRPTDHQQMATISSRGPTADGRMDPDVSASGFAVFAQGANGVRSFVTGTSFSAANTSGGAALLRQAAPWASAEEIREALITSAKPFILEGADDIDQGRGFVDFPAALAALLSGDDDEDLHPSRHRVGRRRESDSTHARHRHRHRVSRYRDDDSDGDDSPSHSVRKNIANLGFRTVKFQGDVFSTHIPALLPGQVAHFFVHSRKDTDLLRITLDNIVPELPLGQQNVFFKDDILLEVVDAPTSFAVRRLLPPADRFIEAPGPFTLEVRNPQTGIVRIAVMGASTNAGRISTDLIIEQERNPQGHSTAKGKVSQGEVDVVQVEIAPGTARAVFELSWKEHWGHYPTDDLDLILFDPDGAASFLGATFSSPERVLLSDPLDGIWTLVVEGFTVHDDADDDREKRAAQRRQGTRRRPSDAESKWELRVTADDTRLRSRRDDDDFDSDDDADSEEDSDSD
jgi:hypothetical protein